MTRTYLLGADLTTYARDPLQCEKEVAAEALAMASKTVLHIRRSTEFDTQGRLGPPLRLTTKVINSETREVIRYATVEFHNEGRDCEGHARTIRNVSPGPGLNEITFDYQHAVVSGVDNVPESWPEEIQEALLGLAQYRLPDGTATLRLHIDLVESPNVIAKLVENLNHNNHDRLWNCHNIGGVQNQRCPGKK